MFVYLTFAKILLGKYYYDLYFTDKETKIQKSAMTCQMSDGGGREDQSSPGSVLSPSHSLAAAGALRDAVCSTHDRVATASVNIL